jgi:hypothetical protein
MFPDPTRASQVFSRTGYAEFADQRGQEHR